MPLASAGAPVQINSTSSAVEFPIDSFTDASGRIGVIYASIVDPTNDLSPKDHFLRYIDGTGAALTAEVRLQGLPVPGAGQVTSIEEITLLSNGNIAVLSRLESANANAYFSQVFSATGQPLGTLTPYPTAQFPSEIIAQSDGFFVVVAGVGGIKGIGFSNSGVSTGDVNLQLSGFGGFPEAMEILPNGRLITTMITGPSSINCVFAGGTNVNIQLNGGQINDAKTAVGRDGALYVVINQHITTPSTFSENLLVWKVTDAGLSTLMATIPGPQNQPSTSEDYIYTNDVEVLNDGSVVIGIERGGSGLPNASLALVGADGGSYQLLDLGSPGGFDGIPSIEVLADQSLMLTYGAGTSSTDLSTFEAYGQKFSTGVSTDIFGTGGIDTLFGTQYGETIQAFGGDDEIHGLAGDDTIFGGEGRDTIFGDAGNDKLYSGGGGGALAGGAGDDKLYADGGTMLMTDNALAVRRLYLTTLGRGPDEGGWMDWTGQLDAGTTSVTGIAPGFVNSAEFQQKYGALDNTAFVTLLYSNVLHRAPDTAGLNDWLGRMQGGMSRAEVVVGFSESAEFKINTDQELHTAQIYRLYAATLGRQPDVGGLLGWVGALQGGGVLDNGTNTGSIGAAFVGGLEFTNKYGASLTNQQFVSLLYQNIFHREADAGGLAQWTGLLDGGASRTSVVLALSESQEHINLTTPALRTFMQTADTTWQNALDGGAGDDNVGGGFGADAFLFNKAAVGTNDHVYSYDAWDALFLTGFGYTTTSDALAKMTQVGDSVVFTDQGETFTLHGTKLADVNILLP